MRSAQEEEDGAFGVHAISLNIHRWNTYVRFEVGGGVKSDERLYSRT